MSKKGSSGNPPKRQHKGRVTQAPCKELGGGRFCEPLNRVVITRSGRLDTSYATCTCGRRFTASSDDLTAVAEAVECGATVPEVEQVIRGLWPVEEMSPWGKIGVVPVGTPVLHRECRAVALEAIDAVAPLGSRLEHTMQIAVGIGLAANQVGADLCVIAHRFPRIAPAVLVNPVILSSRAEWSFVEGCLSLAVAGSRCEVVRPKQVTVQATLLDGRDIVIDADEYVARVLQHEIDHLLGIEYVQRATPEARFEVDPFLEDAGVDLGWLPPRPYPFQ
jgi:peptide deformylase